MYHRYPSRPNPQSSGPGKPPIGEMQGKASFKSAADRPDARGGVHTQKMQNKKSLPHPPACSGSRGNTGAGAPPASKPSKEKERAALHTDAILGLLPPTIYNPDTKKILGLFSAEDLLLVALILVLADSKEEENTLLLYLLLYILVSEYLDFPF